MKDNILNQELPVFELWLDLSGEDCIFTSSQMKRWNPSHLLGCHWYIEMLPSANWKLELTLRATLQKEHNDAVVFGVQDSFREGIESSNVIIDTSVQSGTRKYPTRVARGKKTMENQTSIDVELSLTQNTPSVGGRKRKASTLAPPIVESNSSMEKKMRQSTDNFGSHSTLSIRSEVKPRNISGQKFEELFINDSIHNIRKMRIEGGFSANYDIMLELLHKVNEGRQKTTFLNGVAGIHNVADLVITDAPEGLPVPGIGNAGSIPLWNSITSEDLHDWYATVLSFCKRHLEDDGALLLIQPLESKRDFECLLQSAGLKIAFFWNCNQQLSLTHPHFLAHKTRSFSAVLLVKDGSPYNSEGNPEPTWLRLPNEFKLHHDEDFVNTDVDPCTFLHVENDISESDLFLRPDGKAPWRGSREKSPLFFQILIDACIVKGSIVVDLNASTGASLRACRASGHHFIGLESDFELYSHILKSIENPEKSTNDSIPLRRLGGPLRHATVSQF